MNRARLFLHEGKEEREKEKKGKAEGGEEEELEEREKIPVCAWSISAKNPPSHACL